MRLRYRLVGAALVGLIGSSACGLLPGSQSAATAVPATVAPTAVASPVPPKPAAAASPSASASAVAKPTATTASSALERVWVGNTDGEGVYLRKTPVMADRVK